MRYRLLLILWLLSDVLLFTATYALAYFLRVGWILSSAFPLDRFLWATLTTAPAWLAVLATTRTFALTRNQHAWRNGAYIAYSSLVGVAFFSLVYYFRFKADFQGLSRLLLLEAFALSAGTLWAWHIIFDWIKRALLRMDPPAFPTLIVGLTRESHTLIRDLKRRLHPLTPVAILEGHGAKEKSVEGVPVLGKLNALEETLKERRITHLIQCSDLEQTLNLLSACRKRKITYMLLPSVLGMVERDERIESLEGYPVTVVRPKRSLLGSFFT